MSKGASRALKDPVGIRFWIVDGDDQVARPDNKKKPSPHTLHLRDEDGGERLERPGDRAKRLRARMLQFNKIYNLAWHVRSAQHGREGWRQDKVERLKNALLKELQKCKDPEALLYAVADALTAYPNGLPWER